MAISWKFFSVASHWAIFRLSCASSLVTSCLSGVFQKSVAEAVSSSFFLRLPIEAGSKTVLQVLLQDPKFLQNSRIRCKSHFLPLRYDCMERKLIISSTGTSKRKPVIKCKKPVGPQWNFAVFFSIILEAFSQAGRQADCSSSPARGCGRPCSPFERRGSSFFPFPRRGTFCRGFRQTTSPLQ